MSFRQTRTRNLYRDFREGLLGGWTEGMDTMTNNFVAPDMRTWIILHHPAAFLSLCLLDSNAEKPASVAEQEGSQHIKYQRL